MPDSIRFTWVTGCTGQKEQEAEAAAFGRLYRYLLQQEDSHPFLYNARVLLELQRTSGLNLIALLNPMPGSYRFR